VKNLAMFACLIAALWIALGGIVALIFHNGVMEVICLELAALVLILAAAVLLADDVMGPRR
jgi:hypothetical protein